MTSPGMEKATFFSAGQDKRKHSTGVGMGVGEGRARAQTSQVPRSLMLMEITGGNWTRASQAGQKHMNLYLFLFFTVGMVSTPL